MHPASALTCCIVLATIIAPPVVGEPHLAECPSTGVDEIVSLVPGEAGLGVFPRHAAAQCAVNPGAPTSTVTFFCRVSCPGSWTKAGSVIATLYVENSHDEHTRTCVWGLQGAPVCDGGHAHSDSTLTSTLTVTDRPGASGIVWRAG